MDLYNKQGIENDEKIIKLFRSPTLETVKMVEETIEKYSGEYNQRKIWEKLPRKVMWKTYTHILDYLGNLNQGSPQNV